MTKFYPWSLARILVSAICIGTAHKKLKKIEGKILSQKTCKRNVNRIGKKIM
jgi:hypothetical protein